MLNEVGSRRRPAPFGAVGGASRREGPETMRVRDPFGPLTVLGSLVALGYAVLFLWLRATLPSEPAMIQTDDWRWSQEGVEVRATASSPFEDGDVVVAIDGRSLESWASSLGQPWSPPRLQAPGALTFSVLRSGQPLDLEVPLHQPSLAGLLGRGFGLLIFTTAQLAIAVLTWLRRSREGWRRGFLLGSVANLASAVVWEVGLQPSDLVRAEPTFVLFTLTAPLHLLFWSSLVHVIASFPAQHDTFAHRPERVAALYGLPQLGLLAGVAATRLLAGSTLGWIEQWPRVLSIVIFALLPLVVLAAIRAYRLYTGEAKRQVGPLIVAIVATAIVVLGVTIGPMLLLDRALVSRSMVAVLGLPAVAALGVAIVRYRLFEIAILDRSRRRIVIAREEERRRIRRDLHDGLGPMLAALTLKVDVARDFVRDDPDAAERALDGLRADTQTAVAEVRRLVRELRPPALEELGLVEAIRAQAGAFASRTDGDGRRLEMEVEVEHDLPALNAAVEVAAYRIAVEAMTNVVRHAGARHCIVRLAAERGLELEVLDDGAGVSPGREPGVGLVSMRERAAELGGTWTIDRTASGWTRVAAWLPFEA